MLKNTLYLLWFCLVLSYGCSDSTGPDDNNSGNNGSALATQVIGPGGGTIETDTISITIPSGSFETENELKISVSDIPSFDESGDTPSYRIDGIPAPFSEPITIRIKSDESNPPEFIAVGEDLYCRIDKTIRTFYRLYPATQSNGYLECTLPAMGNGSVTKMVAGKNAAESKINIKVTKASAYKPYTTNEGHFKIAYPAGTVSLNSVQNLGTYLEEAYTLFKNPPLNFSYYRRTEWPIDVTILDLGTEKYGGQSNSMWGSVFGYNGGYLEFNSQKMNDSDALKITAGHEFFHIVQGFYDTRDFYTKSKFKTPWLWFDEATAVWSEEKFTTKTDYASAVRNGTEMRPFNGFKKGAEEDPEGHGYSMSGVIKYLVGIHGEGFLADVYADIFAGIDPITSLFKYTLEPEIWLDNFYSVYILGDIYNDVSFMNVIGTKTDSFEIKSDTDTFKLFKKKYPDLSAKLFIIELQHKNIANAAQIIFTVDGGDKTAISIFKIKTAEKKIEYLDYNLDSVTISDIKKLTDTGWHLIAMVTNYTNTEPYTNTTDITLNVRVNVPDVATYDYNKFDFSFKVIGHYKNSSNNEYDGELNSTYCCRGYGSFHGYTYTAWWDTTFTGSQSKGSMIATFDADMKKIVTFALADSTTVFGSRAVYVTEIEGANLLFEEEYDGKDIYRLYGTEVKNVLNSAYYKAESNSFWTEARTFDCDDNSMIFFGFSKE